MTLIEVLVALTLVTFGTLAVFSGLLTTSVVDSELRDRGIALRAGLSQIERVLTFEHEGEMQNLLDAFHGGGQDVFSVPDLRPTDAAAAAGANDAQGTIALDTTDPERVRVLVTVEWKTRQGERRLALPATMTEVVP